MDSARRKTQRIRMGVLPPRYSFVVNPYVRERFTKCPSLEQVIIAAGLSAGGAPGYLVLGTIERRIWRQGLVGDAQLADIREHMADFKKPTRQPSVAMMSLGGALMGYFVVYGSNCRARLVR